MTYVTHQSFASRMCGGLCGSLFGVAIYLLTFLLAGWNEGAYISGLEVLEHAYEVVDEHPCNAASLPQDGSLVFLEGCQLAGLPEWPAGEFQLSGPRTGAWFETAVEMYQWREVQHSETRKDAVGGGSTTVYWYSHERRWFSTAQPSPQNCDQSRPTDPCKPSTECHAGQGHCNPPLPASPLSGKQTAQTGAIRVGEAARLNSAQLGQLKSRRPLTPASEVLRGEPATLPLASLLPRNCRWDGAWATSAPPGGPRVGDTRVRWAVSAASEASVLAAVGAGGVMVPWRSGVRAKVAGLKQTLNELREGAVPLDEFFDALHAEAAGQVWALRFLSLFLFWLGLVLFTRPIAIAPDLVPCIGPAIGDLAGCLLALAALAAALTTSLLVTAFFWLWFRPAVGVPLLLLALAAGCLMLRLRRRASRGKRARVHSPQYLQSSGASLASQDVTTPMPPAGGCGCVGGGGCPVVGAVAVPMATEPSRAMFHTAAPAGGVPTVTTVTPASIYPQIDAVARVAPVGVAEPVEAVPIGRPV